MKIEIAMNYKGQLGGICHVARVTDTGIPHREEMHIEIHNPSDGITEEDFMLFVLSEIKKSRSLLKVAA